MSLDRRSVLKGMAAAGASVVACPAAEAREPRKPPPDAVGMLYDATKCIGCQNCVSACRRANELPLEEDSVLWDSPRDLSARTKNIIKVRRDETGERFVKAQCMHCVDPACVSVCMIGALHKSNFGVVAYDPALCIGCRYCQVACPFNVPKFEWDTATPKVVKCEMCRHLLVKGELPACCQICPTGAVIFGKRDELLVEAHRRLDRHPDRYHPKVYGERDGGGTQVLYLSAIPFEELGLPDLGDEAVPTLSVTLQHAIYKGFIAPVALYALLGGVMWRNRKRAEPPASEEGSRDAQG